MPVRKSTRDKWKEVIMRTVRQECLDHRLFFGERDLQCTLEAYITYYNEARPHQGLLQQTPIPYDPRLPEGVIRRRDVLNGLLHDYYREAA